MFSDTRYTHKNNSFSLTIQAGIPGCHTMVTFYPYLETNDTLPHNKSQAISTAFALLLSQLI